MSWRRSIRVQLTIAMIAIAVIATACSSLIANRSLHEHLKTMSASTTTSQIADGERAAVSAELNRQHALAGVIATAVAIMLALLFGRRLTTPINDLSVVASELAAGDLSVAVPQSGPSEIRLLAEHFERLRRELAQQDRLRRLGFSDLAHELRTPVTNISARLEAAQDGVISIERGLPVMCAEAARLRRLLDQLSMLVDLESPHQQRERSSVNLAEVARRQACLIEARLIDNGLNLVVDADAAVCTRGDPERIEQVICNLLSNALTYSNHGGMIRIAVTSVGDRAVLTVEDEGVGIPPEELPYVMRRFWRGPTSRQRARDGSGVGLAVVDEIVRSHDGTLALTSKPAQGTTARVDLPLLPSTGRSSGAQPHPLAGH